MGNAVRCVKRKRNEKAPKSAVEHEPHEEPELQLAKEPEEVPRDQDKSNTGKRGYIMMARPREGSIDICNLAETLVYRSYRHSFALKPASLPKKMIEARGIIDSMWKDGYDEQSEEHPAFMKAFYEIFNAKLMKTDSHESPAFLIAMSKLKKNYSVDKAEMSPDEFVAHYKKIMDDIYDKFVSQDPRGMMYANVGGVEREALKDLKAAKWEKEGELIDPRTNCGWDVAHVGGAVKLKPVGEWHCAEIRVAECAMQAYTELWNDPKAKAWLETHSVEIIAEHDEGCGLGCSDPDAAHSGHYNELLPVMHHKHHKSRRSKAAGDDGVYSYESYPLQQHANYDVYDHQMQPLIGNKYEYDASSVLLPMLIMVVICVVGMCAFCVSSVASWIACYLFAVKEERKYMKCNNDDVADVERGFNSSN